MKKNYNCGSSETTRKAPYFDFSDFYKYGHAEHVPRISEEFLEWFIGFFEGDGSLSYRENGSYTRLSVSVAQKEKKILDKIAYTFGFGRVSCTSSKSSVWWRWTLESKKTVKPIYFLLSGNLILPNRQQQFLNWVKVGEKKGIFQPGKTKPWSSSISLNNGWLSGFIDAEGCFYAAFRLSTAKKYVKYEKLLKSILIKKFSKTVFNKKEQEILEIFYLSKPNLRQKMLLAQKNDQLTFQVFEEIAKLFETQSLSKYKFKNKTTYYVQLELNTLESQEILIDYLWCYKLKTIKYISFRRWWRVYLRRKNGIHLSPKGIKRLFRLVKAINQHTAELYDKSYIEK